VVLVFSLTLYSNHNQTNIVLKHLFTLILFFIQVLAFTQESIDLLTVSGRFGLPSPYEDGVDGKATESGGMVNLRIPIVLDSTNIWYSKITYLKSSVNSTLTFADSIANPIHVHGVILQTGLVRKLSRGRSIQLLFVPRLMGDMKNVSTKNVQLGAVALYEKRFNSNLKMKFGAMYNQELSGPFVVPLVDVDWKLSDRWSLTGLVPIYSKVKYKFSDNTNAGIGHFALITSYRLGTEAYQDDYMERTSIDIYTFLRQRISGNFHVEARAGYALGRSYEQYDENDSVDFRFSLFTWGDDRVQKNAKFSDGAFLNLRLVYNLPID
jgi:hypothetical protein